MRDSRLSSCKSGGSLLLRLNSTETDRLPGYDFGLHPTGRLSRSEWADRPRLRFCAFGLVRSTVAARSEPGAAFFHPPLRGPIFYLLHARRDSKAPTLLAFADRNAETMSLWPYGQVGRLFFLRRECGGQPKRKATRRLAAAHMEAKKLPRRRRRELLSATCARLAFSSLNAGCLVNKHATSSGRVLARAASSSLLSATLN